MLGHGGCGAVVEAEDEHGEHTGEEDQKEVGQREQCEDRDLGEAARHIVRDYLQVEDQA